MINPPLKKARPSRRFRATLIDFLLMFAAGLILFLPTIVYGFIYNLDEVNRSFITLIILSCVSGFLYLIALLIYLIFLPYRWDGQTIGRRIYSIRVVNKNGENASFGTLFFRESMRIILFMLTLGLSLVVDFVIILFGRKNISYYDVFASTRVIELS